MDAQPPSRVIILGLQAAAAVHQYMLACLAAASSDSSISPAAVPQATADMLAAYLTELMSIGSNIHLHDPVSKKWSGQSALAASGLNLSTKQPAIWQIDVVVAITAETFVAGLAA